MKKIYYYFVIAMEGIMIISTLINVIFCLITYKIDIFITSIYLVFVPINRFLNSNNYFELLLLLFFIGITIVFYIFSAKEILNKKIEKTPFIILNAIWIYMSGICLMFLNSNEAKVILNLNPIFVSISAVSIIGLIILKWSDLNKLYRNKPVPDYEDPLPENFQLKAKSYKQIKRTALGTPVISIGVFLFNLLLVYINSENSVLITFRNLMYGFSIFLELIILFGTIHDCKEFQKITGEKVPKKDFLRKLNAIQIVSIVLFVLSFFVLNMI